MCSAALSPRLALGRAGEVVSVIELSGVAPGDKLRLVGGITAEVVEIVNDEWARVRLLEVPGGEPGAEELCHATDITEVI
jgi:hypothetical protein